MKSTIHKYNTKSGKRVSMPKLKYIELTDKRNYELYLISVLSLSVGILFGIAL